MREKRQFSTWKRIFLLLFFVRPWHADAQVNEWKNVPGFASTIITIDVTEQIHAYAGQGPSSVSVSAIQTLFADRLQAANFHKSICVKSFAAVSVSGVQPGLKLQQAIYNFYITYGNGVVSHAHWYDQEAINLCKVLKYKEDTFFIHPQEVRPSLSPLILESQTG